MKELIFNTLFSFRLEHPTTNPFAAFTLGAINTSIRLGALYVAIRVVMTALHQGAFLQ